MSELPPRLTTSRREFLRRAGGGFGSLALTDLMLRDGRLLAQEAAGQDPKPFGKGGGVKANGLHHEPKAKSVIYLFLYGGPSGIDTFEGPYKLFKRPYKDLVRTLRSLKVLIHSIC